jgi:adenylyl- and sulfurtransferase ThiI
MTTKATGCSRMIVTVSDAQALAKRLLARGISSFSTAARAEKSDLKLAARLLLLLLEDYKDQECLEVDAG